MSRSDVLRRLEVYENARLRLAEQRENLRSAVAVWKVEGATIVEIAETLGWSRQSVYDLLSNGR